jgi:uncharacterized protein YbbK (DUF523 family)
MNKKLPDNNRPRVGVSSCLLGNEVRYEGSHRRNECVTTVLAESYRLIAVCPELEAGFGVPREATLLMGERQSPRMIGIESGNDKTTQLIRFARHRVRRDDLRLISGFVFKSKSPSCGVERVKLFSTLNRFTRTGTGLFVSTLLDRYPYLPVIEEDGLDDTTKRENFLIRLNVLHRLQQLYVQRFSREAMLRFHQSNRDLLSGHRKHTRQLDDLINEIGEFRTADFRQKYRALLMAALSAKSVR